MVVEGRVDTRKMAWYNRIVKEFDSADAILVLKPTESIVKNFYMELANRKLTEKRKRHAPPKRYLV